MDPVQASAARNLQALPSVKRRFRRGQKNALNVFIIQDALANGHATFPTDLSDDASMAIDGVMLRSDRLIGAMSWGAESWEKPPDYIEMLGTTAVHEIGHWLGLLHTFTGSCGYDDPGDLIKDTTPQVQIEARFDERCESRTCDGERFPDHNFMGYADE